MVNNVEFIIQEFVEPCILDPTIVILGGIAPGLTL